MDGSTIIRKNVKNCILTGAYGTLGKKTLYALLDHQMKVIAFTRTAQDKKMLEKELALNKKSNVHVLHGDLTSAEVVSSLIAESKNLLHDEIHSLIHTVGVFHYNKITDSTEDQYHSLFNGNLKTAWLMGKYVLKEMEKQRFGRILYVSSHTALKQGTPGVGLYAASKSALNQLALSMQKEMGTLPISINTVLPSIIENPENKKTMPNINSNTWVQPEDLAQFLCSLLNPYAEAMRGALINYPAFVTD
jgi:NAD(P)-dependent dehydrogenase (short-subunit alcohol dehydrogenase family)